MTKAEQRDLTDRNGRVKHSSALAVGFWTKVDRGGECWLWGGSTSRTGYGKTYFQGKPWRAHRLAYTLAVGPIPDGLTIDHLCRVRHCVRPSHLEAVPLRENIRRSDGPCALKARQTHCKNGHPLTPENLRPNRRGRACVICHRVYNLAAYHNRRKAG